MDTRRRRRNSDSGWRAPGRGCSSRSRSAPAGRVRRCAFRWRSDVVDLRGGGAGADRGPPADAGMAAIGVRIAGLPAVALERLRCPAATGCVEEILRLEDRLHAESQVVCGALYELIGRAPAPDLKPRLVGLRRAVHAGRRPAAHLLDERVQQALPPQLADRLRGWTDRLARRDALRRELPGRLRTDVDAAAAALRETVAGPTMQLGLVYSNAATFRAARRWVAQSGTRPADKVAVRLARYVSRAAAKTSPFTLFTSSGLGSWREGGPVLAMRDTQPRSAVELGLATLQQVVTGLAGRPSTPAHLLVRINPTVTVDGDVVRFVAPRGHRPARAVRRTPALDALLPGLPPGQTRAALGDWLAGHVGDPARADEFVDRLLRMGLLELYLPVADQALHPRAVLAWLDERAAGLSADPGVTELRAVLRRLADLLDEYASATVPAVRLACREQLDAAV